MLLKKERQTRMKKILLISTVFLILTFCSIPATGQNLIMNPSFENYDSLPCNFIINSLQFSSMMNYWTAPNYLTPDICSPLISTTCYYGNPQSQSSAGLQTPRTGSVMIGMVCQNGGYNEYIQAPLTTPIVPGNSYQAEMYVSLASKSDFASNDLAMYFSDTLILDSAFQSSNYVPKIIDTLTITDTANWVLVSGCFTATTPANYIIIGNFVSSCAHETFLGGGWPMSYYFIDDISVTQIPSCDKMTVCSTVGINEAETENKFQLYPNPFSSSTTLRADKILKGVTLTVYNSLGQQVKQIKNISGQTITLYRDNLPSGLYFIRLTQDNKTLKADKLIITD